MTSRTFFSLPLDFSMLELEPETGADPVRYFCTPENAEILGWGSCGTHFVLLPGDEAVYCVEPELAGEGTYVLPVGAGLPGVFIPSVLLRNPPAPWPRFFCWTSPGSGSSWQTMRPTPGRLGEDFKRRDASLALLAEAFRIQPRDPFRRVRALQAAFDPSAPVFSAEYYDVLGIGDAGRRG